MVVGALDAGFRTATFLEGLRAFAEREPPLRCLATLLVGEAETAAIFVLRFVATGLDLAAGLAVVSLRFALAAARLDGLAVEIFFLVAGFAFADVFFFGAFLVTTGDEELAFLPTALFLDTVAPGFVLGRPEGDVLLPALFFLVFLCFVFLCGGLKALIPSNQGVEYGGDGRQILEICQTELFYFMRNVKAS